MTEPSFSLRDKDSPSQKELDRLAIEQGRALMADLERRSLRRDPPPEPQLIRLELYGERVEGNRALEIQAWLTAYLQAQIMLGRELVIGTTTSGGDLNFSQGLWQRLTNELIEGVTNGGIGVGIASPSAGRTGSVRWRVFPRPTSNRFVTELQLTMVVNSEREAIAGFVESCIDLADVTALPQGRLVTPGLPAGLRFDLTPVERKRAFGPAALSRYIRGIGWGIWLGEALLNQLGGRQTAADAPVARVVERVSGMWFELTDDPLGPVEEDVRESFAAFFARVIPSVAELIAIDRTPREALRIQAARAVDRTQPCGFAIESIFTHPDGTMVRGVVTHGAIPPIGTLVQVYSGEKRVAVVPMNRAIELPEEPLVMLTLAGLNPRRIPPHARLCTDRSVLLISPPEGLLLEADSG